MQKFVKPTIVVGASDKPERYSWKAMMMLKEYGHPVLGVHPRLSEVESVNIYSGIIPAAAALNQVDTVTLYVGVDKSSALFEDIIQSAAKRVIFNPGAENPELAARLQMEGVQTLEACTLVMLRTEVW